MLQTYRPQVVVVEEVRSYRYLLLLKRYGCRVVLDAQNVETDREKYTNLLFVGVFGYPPNEAAAHVLIHQIWPPSKQRYPDADIGVTGRVPEVRL